MVNLPKTNILNLIMSKQQINPHRGTFYKITDQNSSNMPVLRKTKRNEN